MVSVATRPAGQYRQLSTPKPQVAEAAGRLLRFMVGGAQFALPLTAVAEVVAIGSATAKAPRGWIGTLVRNEQPIPLADLAFLLGMPATAATRRDLRALMLRADEAGAPTFGVTIESIPTVVQHGAEALHAVPPLARRASFPVVRQALVHEDELLFVLDRDLLIERLAGNVKRKPDGRIAELRALPRTGNGEVQQQQRGAVVRATHPGAVQRDTAVLLLAPVETADGGSGFLPAVPTNWVQEVRPMQVAQRLPHAPPGLTGLVAWRGQVLPVLDLTQRLTGIPGRSMESGARLVVIGPPGGVAHGILVLPSTRGLATIPAGTATDALPLPATLDPTLLTAWMRHRDEPVAILDPAKLFV